MHGSRCTADRTPQPWELFARADAATAAGDRRRTLAVLQDTVHRYPDLPIGWSELGAVFLAAGNPHAAFLSALRGIALHPAHVESATVAGTAALALGDITRAVAYLSLAESLEFHAPEVHAALMRALAQDGRYGCAVTAGARWITCAGCTASVIIASVRRRNACRAIATVVLPADAPKDAHAFVAAAHAITLHRTIPALAALNRILTQPTSTSEYRDAARTLHANSWRP